MKDLLIDGSVPSKPAETFDERSLLRGRPRDVAGTASHAPDRTGSYKPATEVGGRHHVDNEGDPMVPRLRAQRAVPSWSRHSAFAGDGSAVWNGERVTLAISIDEPRALLGGGESQVGMKLAAAPIALNFSGRVTGLPPAKLSGVIALETKSVRQLAQ